MVLDTYFSPCVHWRATFVVLVNIALDVIVYVNLCINCVCDLIDVCWVQYIILQWEYGMWQYCVDSAVSAHFCVTEVVDHTISNNTGSCVCIPIVLDVVRGAAEISP